MTVATDTGWSRRQVIDDGYKHSLIVYEDLQTRGIRLHAAVWEGELRQCPVWTAFGKRNMPLSCPSRREAYPSSTLGSQVLSSDTPIPVPDMAQPTLEAPSMAQRCPAVRILQNVQAGEHAAEQDGSFRDILCQRGR